MWPIQAPRISAIDSYEQCIGRARQQRLLRLSDARDAVALAGLQYDLAALEGKLWELSPQDFEVAGFSNEDFVRVYTDNMVPKDSAGRDIYDSLMSTVRLGRCPFCGHRDVKTMDHFLPKSLFPLLCVMPANLIPCCSDCNRLKGDRASARAEDLMLHPYFDSIDDHQWLRSRLIPDSPPRLTFFVHAHEDWDPTTSIRVESHFTLLGLDELYALQANREMSGIKLTLQKIHAAGGCGEVRDHLALEAESRAADTRNSWQAAMYQALADSRWFCNGGFDR